MSDTKSESKDLGYGETLHLDQLRKYFKDLPVKNFEEFLCLCDPQRIWAKFLDQHGVDIVPPSEVPNMDGTYNVNIGVAKTIYQDIKETPNNYMANCRVSALKPSIPNDVINELEELFAIGDFGEVYCANLLLSYLQEHNPQAIVVTPHLAMYNSLPVDNWLQVQLGNNPANIARGRAKPDPVNVKLPEDIKPVELIMITGDELQGYYLGHKHGIRAEMVSRQDKYPAGTISYLYISYWYMGQQYGPVIKLQLPENINDKCPAPKIVKCYYNNTKVTLSEYRQLTVEALSTLNLPTVLSPLIVEYLY